MNCPHHILDFDNAQNLQKFLSDNGGHLKWGQLFMTSWTHNIICPNTILYCRKRDAYYAVIIRRGTEADLGMHQLWHPVLYCHIFHHLLTGTFLKDHPFFTKVLNAAFFVGDNSDGFRSFIKPVCSAETASVYNMWSQEGGFTLNLPLFQPDILADLSCKKFKATAFSYPPRMTITELPDGNLKWVIKKKEMSSETCVLQCFKC